MRGTARRAAGKREVHYVLQLYVSAFKTWLNLPAPAGHACIVTLDLTCNDLKIT
jgi:hypothetical protein